MAVEPSPTEHQLWVNLSSLSDGNFFAFLPNVVRQMMESDADELDFDSYDLILPSDDAWQAKIYYQLVERQRIADAAGESMFDYEEGQQQPPKLHDWVIRPKKKQIQCGIKRSVKSKKNSLDKGAIRWTISDISKAGCLLSQPALPADFEDEEEMRRVYTLIYDVFRHKIVLNQALKDVNFFHFNPELEKNLSHIWLLLYDLYHRSFQKRETAVAALAQFLFDKCALTKPESVLWGYRTKLAAAIARLRIQNNALSLNDLLPGKLKGGKVPGSGNNAPFTCWLNLKKTNLQETGAEIEAAFGLEPGQPSYELDQHCPNVLVFDGSRRGALARSAVIKSHKLISQNKSFCLGPATFAKHLLELELKGSVIQTHINSPRTTAYLASILSQNEKIGRLLVFGAGGRKDEYEAYFRALAMSTLVVIHRDRLVDVSPDSGIFEEVVAIFATPPNSYSAVNDPIELVCSRGGDLSMLEVLTESQDNEAGRERVREILDEQRRTLRFAMSRPQIQFVLYETHSEIEAENGEMVQRTVREVNRLAKLHHANLQGKLGASAPEEGGQEVNNNNNNEASEVIKLTTFDSEERFGAVLVPDTDVFEVPELPALCPSDTPCIDYAKEGCFLALVQRQEVIRLDNKYMIQMAEHRGLFGRTSSSSTRAKGSRSRKKQEKPPTPPPRTKRRIKDAELARIAAPTHTFLRHTNCEVAKCQKCRLDDDEEEPSASVYKRWWLETARHITALRANLALGGRRQKNKKVGVEGVLEAMKVTRRIDELVAESREDAAAVPLFPRLKLPRERRVEKVQLYLPVTNLRDFF